MKLRTAREYYFRMIVALLLVILAPWLFLPDTPRLCVAVMVLMSFVAGHRLAMARWSTVK